MVIGLGWDQLGFPVRSSVDSLNSYSSSSFYLAVFIGKFNLSCKSGAAKRMVSKH